MKTIHQLDANDITGIIASHFGVGENDVGIKAKRVLVGSGEAKHTEYAINCTVTIDTKKQEPPPDLPPEPEPKAQPTATYADKQSGVKGRLQLNCPECGNAFGTFLHEYQQTINCKCGHAFNLTDPLASFRFTCPYCRNEGWGKTNSEDAEIAVRCRCGEDLTLEWDAASREYRN